MTAKLTLDDIADLRAYEREREAFRAEIIALKRRRRVGVGPFVTVLFENRETIRFQIQEMARVEKILTDDGIQSELDTYNPLIPESGSLAATLFIELTSKEDLMTWLPMLVGIERTVQLRVGDVVVSARPDPDHERQLTRETITPSVHYIHFELEPAEVDAFATDGAVVHLEVEHDRYQHSRRLDEATVEELVHDLRGQ